MPCYSLLLVDCELRFVTSGPGKSVGGCFVAVVESDRLTQGAHEGQTCHSGTLTPRLKLTTDSLNRPSANVDLCVAEQL